MNLKQFLNKTQLRMLNEELSIWASGYGLELKLTGFHKDHAVGYDANGENTLTELRTQLIDVRDLRFRRMSDRPDSSLLEVYVKTKTRLSGVHGGLREPNQRLVEIRGPGREFIALEFEERTGEARHDAWQLSKLLTHSGKLERETAQERIKEMLGNWDFHGRRELEEMLPEGYRIVTDFEFSISLRLQLMGVKVTKRGVTLATRTNGTYQSLPGLIELTKKREIKTVSLADLGVETSGYYSHCTRLEVRPEQVEAAKALARRARSISRGGAQ